MMSQEWTLRQALFFLIGSVCATLLFSLGGYFAFTKYHEKKIQDQNYRILSIVQTGPDKEALKTTYLAELLGISVDRPISLYAFDCRAGEKKLLSSPLIKSATIERMPPNALYIDYEIRKPVAMLADYKNIAIDEQGYLFPFAPFFAPKEIPEIYLGLPPFGFERDGMDRKGGEWLVPIQNGFLKMAFEVLHVLEDAPWKEGFRVKRIDVSNAFARSLGQREIVLFTEEELTFRKGEKEILAIFPKVLRLSPKDFNQQLDRFFVLRRNMEDVYRKQLSHLEESSRFSSRIIDLRIPQLAFVQN